jgi:hypothetical protein
MSRRGLSMLEVLIGSVILALLIGISMAGFNMLGRQSKHAFESLGQAQEAQLLLETIRLELSSMVMNPFADPKDHEGNSFIISRPNGTSIQFVTEKREGDRRQRYLVYYEARNEGDAAPPGLTLTKTVWKFTHDGTWGDKIRFPPGWPTDWIGPQVEKQKTKWQGLNIQDMRWQYLVPDENEGRVFFRMKMVLKAREGTRLMPITTLVAVSTPDLPASISDCPCLFDARFDPNAPDCNVCITAPPPPPADNDPDGGEE